jgi:(1->4)-alpha-D-glucan 1-alpha-D-glucosylmutase
VGVYRTYVVPSADGPPAGEADRAVIDAAMERARATPDIDPELLDLLTDILTGDQRGDPEALFIHRFQQLTGPIAAKGEEDTALYRWLPLPHRSEVGADPSRPPTTSAEWHAACLDAQARWPQRLTALSTHDTKRSGDARARLAALTAVPDELLAAFEAWRRAVDVDADSDAGVDADADSDAGVDADADADADADGMDAGSAWLVFHALVAAWPLDADRAWAIVEKSLREAGLRTSWVRPDEEFECAVRAVVDRAVADAAARSLIDDLVLSTADASEAAALAQLAVQLLAPGVPDVYQGGEAWDRTLVDPDNRRPPDPIRRQELVASAATVDAATAWADPALRATGLARTVVLRRVLEARRRHLAAVGPGGRGAYTPLPVTGPDAERVLAFTRGEPAELAVVVTRPGGEVDATVTLPDGPWTQLFTLAEADGTSSVAKLTADFPIAVLER